MADDCECCNRKKYMLIGGVIVLIIILLITLVLHFTKVINLKRLTNKDCDKPEDKPADPEKPKTT